MAQYPNRVVYDLDGEWKYLKDTDDVDVERIISASFDRSNWKPIQVPSNWYLTEIGDYDGAVWFCRTFDVDKKKGTLYTLEFLAVDYIAEVWLNGVYIGCHEGYFNPFSFRVEHLLLPKQNVLVVKVISPRDPTEYVLVEDPHNLSTPMSTPYKRHWAKDLSIVKGHLIDAMHRPGDDEIPPGRKHRRYLAIGTVSSARCRYDRLYENLYKNSEKGFYSRRNSPCFSRYRTDKPYFVGYESTGRIYHRSCKLYLRLSA